MLAEVTTHEMLALRCVALIWRRSGARRPASHAQVAVARINMFVRLHDKHRAEATTNSDICPRAATAAAACCRLSPV
jgi:hypothetical protein